MVIRIERLNNERLANLLTMISFVLFFNDELVRNVVAKAFNVVGLPGYLYFSFFVMYIPLIIAFMLRPKKMKIDMFVCILGVVAFFVITYFFHPEYAEWFLHEEYSVSNRVFRLDRAIYAYLFIRAITDKEQLMKSLEITAFIRFFYYLSTFMSAQVNGYWLENNMAGELIKMSYSLSFGYKMLFSSIVFMYLFVIKKKKVYLPFLVISIFTILLGGSRGPLIGMLVAVLFLIWQFFVNSPSYKKLIVMFVGVSAIVFILTVGFDAVIDLVKYVAVEFDISSRSIDMFLKGTLSENNGRDKIYGLAINMIKENPFGYGMYGDRYVIGQYYYWGYCHNIFLELLIDFGVVLGLLIILFILWKSIKMLFMCKDETYKFIFFIFFTSSLQLLLSSSFWYSPFFWACIAIGVNYSKSVRDRNNE